MVTPANGIECVSLFGIFSGEIMSISYSTIKVNKKDELKHTLHVPPFVVTSKSAKMVFLNAGLFEEMPTDPICKVGILVPFALLIFGLRLCSLHSPCNLWVWNGL